MTEAAGPLAVVATALVFAPLILALLLFVLPARWQLGRLAPLLAVLLALALLGALGVLSADLLAGGAHRLALGARAAPLGIELAVDGLSLAMLWMSALVALAVNLWAADWLRDPANQSQAAFRVIWPILWSGLNALFLSADLFNVYVTLEIVTLGAVALVVLTRGHAALHAAIRYLLFALAGSILYLLGVALAYGASGVLAFALLPAALPPSPSASTALLVITAGLAMKAAMFPVHGWLPPAHAAAPSPASAVLSALVAKAGAYLILRLWLGPFGAHWSDTLAQAMAAIGAAGIVYGSVQALRQTQIKRVIAYSTIAQLGYLPLLLPLASIAAWQGVLYHALNHGLAKAAMFLAAGNLVHALGDDRIQAIRTPDRHAALNLAAIAIAGVSLAGLPPSGGFIAKWWLLEAAFAQGQWWWAIVILAGALLAAAYIVRLLRPALSSEAFADSAPPGTAHAPIGALRAWAPFALAALTIVLGFCGNALAPLLVLGLPARIGG